MQKSRTLQYPNAALILEAHEVVWHYEVLQSWHMNKMAQQNTVRNLILEMLLNLKLKYANWRLTLFKMRNWKKYGYLCYQLKAYTVLATAQLLYYTILSLALIPKFRRPVRILLENNAPLPSPFVI